MSTEGTTLGKLRDGVCLRADHSHNHPYAIIFNAGSNGMASNTIITNGYAFDIAKVTRIGAMKRLLSIVAATCVILSSQTLRAAGWSDWLGKAGTPRLVAFSRSATPPTALPFVAERKLETGFWTSFDSPPVIGKIAETAVKSEGTNFWVDTGMWMHAREGSAWVSLPVYETAGAAAGAVKKGDTYFTLHPAFWKGMQSTRPPAPKKETAVRVAAKTGSFTANLGKYEGTPVTPDDRKENPFFKTEGQPGNEQASVVVPPDYDGTKPYGLMVFIEPESNGTGNIRGNWKDDLAARKLIWVAAMKSGNDQQGERRVWLAQQARAWALHHYSIDTGRMIISGFSNGGDAASATAVATPFGFNNALLLAPPCEPPLGTVHVPREFGGGSTATVQPLSSSGISHMKKNWRIAYVVGTKDGFLSTVRSSAKAVEDFKQGSKLFEIDGLGHGTPETLAEPLDFLLAPRSQAPAKEGFAVDSYLADIRRATAAGAERGRTAMTQFWNNHPEARNHPEVLALLKQMEAIP